MTFREIEVFTDSAPTPKVDLLEWLDRRCHSDLLACQVGPLQASDPLVSLQACLSQALRLLASVDLLRGK